MNIDTGPRYMHGDPLRAILRAWRTMETAPTTGPIVWVEVKLADGRTVRAHYACDLSGEDQPPFQGWFERVGSDQWRYFSSVDPVAWRPLA